MPEISREYYQLQGIQNVQDVAFQLNFILNRISDRLDQIEGLRGTPTFHKNFFDFPSAEGLVAGQVLKATSSSQAAISTISASEVTSAVSDLSSGTPANIDISQSLISMRDFENDTVVHQFPADWFNGNSEVQGFYTHEDLTPDQSYGNVAGPASAVDSNIAEFSGTDGKSIKDGGLSHADAASAISLKHTQNTDTQFSSGYVKDQEIASNALLSVYDYNDTILHQYPIEWAAYNTDVFGFPGNGMSAPTFDQEHTLDGVTYSARSESLAATTGNYSLHAVATAGHGVLMAGANVYSATFRCDNAGNVQLLDSDSGGIIVANADTAGKICIGRATPADPIEIYNRTASPLTIMTLFWHN